MNFEDCYRVLGLRSGASFSDVKASYRRLARMYHPDIHPDDQKAKDKFIEVTKAYRSLMERLQNTSSEEELSPTANPTEPPIAGQVKITVEHSGSAAHSTSNPGRQSKIQFNPDLSPLELKLKEGSFEQLQKLLKMQKFPRAIALVEALADRIAQDPEVRQWQAITYQQWGRHLIQQKKFDKARIYLKKALKADPHNRSLWAEVDKDFKKMEQNP